MRAPSPATAGPVGQDWAIPRGLVVLLSLAAVVVTVAGITLFSSVIGPTFLALILTVTVQPIQDWARKRGWPGWLGMLAAFSAVMLILVALVGALALSVAQLASQLPVYSDQLDHARGWLAYSGVSIDQINRASTSAEPSDCSRRYSAESSICSPTSPSSSSSCCSWRSTG